MFGFLSNSIKPLLLGWLTNYFSKLYTHVCLGLDFWYNIGLCGFFRYNRIRWLVDFYDNRHFNIEDKVIFRIFDVFFKGLNNISKTKMFEKEKEHAFVLSFDNCFRMDYLFEPQALLLGTGTRLWPASRAITSIILEAGSQDWKMKCKRRQNLYI